MSSERPAKTLKLLQSGSADLTGNHKGFRAFTLAEVLIALAILGLIATFTIPKILTNNQNNQWNAAAKEAASIVSEALQAYSADTPLTAGTSALAILPYINYVSAAGDGWTQDMYGNSTQCYAGNTHCIKLHSGAVLVLHGTFPGTDPNAMVWYDFDPDGFGPGIGVSFALYANGFITDQGHLKPASYSSYSNPQTSDPNNIPPWLSWH